jgi:hypothetical protein
MNKRRNTAFLILLLFIAYPAVSQDVVVQETVTDEKVNDFLLIPILETAFSGVLRWRPDWPPDIPPDGFSLLEENIPPEIIELSNGEMKFFVKRDREGRLVEFPFFLTDGYAAVEISYAWTGAVKEMSVIFFSGETDEADTETEGDFSQSDSAQSDQKLWNIIFPDDFLPYSEFSPGGSFPPLTIFQDEEVYSVFIFESPGFLTEAWYDGEGEMLLFCEALVDHEDAGWRVRSLQVHDSDGLRFVDYNFDSGGNTTEVQIEDNTFSAVYRGSRPVSWQLPDLRYELQWDTQGTLTVVKAAGETVDLVTEYRYEYERDIAGNWLKRRETAYGDRFGVLAPYLPGNRGTWERRIVFFEGNDGER